MQKLSVFIAFLQFPVCHHINIWKEGETDRKEKKKRRYSCV